MQINEIYNQLGLTYTNGARLDTNPDGGRVKLSKAKLDLVRRSKYII